MSATKISELTNYTTPDNTDVVPIVDTPNTTTKKITWANIKANLKAYFDTLYLTEASGDAQYEVLTNKSTDTALGSSNTLYPTQNAVKTYADSLVVGLLDYRGAYDASGNTFPASGGSGTAGAILKGDTWVISVAGTLGGSAIQIGDTIIANVDTPGQTDGNWNKLNTNISYVPEDSANKVTSISGASTDTQYPSAKLVYDQLATKYGSGASPSFATITSSSLTASEMVITDGSKNLVSAAVATYPSLTELSYVKGLTSSAQTQLTARLPLTGGTMTGSITLGENTGIALDPAGSADGKWSGITVTGTAGYTQAFGDLVYLSSADSRWEAADADAASTADRMLAMVVSAGTDGTACTLLLQGIIRADAKFPALTIGSAVYVGETAGAIQVAIPTGADNVIRRVGYALTADEIYFNPSMDSQISVA